MDLHASVAIVGAGPTGLIAANLLGMAGIETTLLERNAALSDYPKAIAIDDEGLRVCQAAGLAGAVLDHALPGIHAHYLSGKHFLARITPTGMRNGHPQLSTFHQPTFEATLLGGLARFACVTVLFGHSVEGFEQDAGEVRLRVRAGNDVHLTITCAYVLACDGAHSFVRRALGIAMRPPDVRAIAGRDATYVGRALHPSYASVMQRRGARWLVVDCVNDDDPATVATFFCNPARPAVTVPAPGHRRRWEFMLLPGEREEDLLDRAVIQQLIRRARASRPRSAGCAVNVEPQITRQALYTFHALLATRLSQGRIFLLGDAAHLMPPFGGQGMNSGLRDAHNLCWKLQMALQGRASPRLLESYQQERAPHAALMILFSSLLGTIIMPTSRPLARLRDLFFRGIVNAIPPLRAAISSMRVKPRPRYRRGFLISGARGVCRALTGVMLPQPHVLTPAGERILLDDALGHGFTILRLYENPGAAFAPLKDELWEALAVRFICVLPTNVKGGVCQENRARDDEERCAVIVDSEGELGAFLRQRRDIYVLVRPDRYVLGAFRAAQAGKFATAFKRLWDQHRATGIVP